MFYDEDEYRDIEKEEEFAQRMYDEYINDQIEQAIMDRLDREQKKAFTYLKEDKVCSTWKSGDKYYMNIDSEFGVIRIEFPHKIIEGA